MYFWRFAFDFGTQLHHLFSHPSAVVTQRWCSGWGLHRWTCTHTSGLCSFVPWRHHCGGWVTAQEQHDWMVSHRPAGSTVKLIFNRQNSSILSVQNVILDWQFLHSSFFFFTKLFFSNSSCYEKKIANGKARTKVAGWTRIWIRICEVNMHHVVLLFSRPRPLHLQGIKTFRCTEGARTRSSFYTVLTFPHHSRCLVLYL